MIAGKPARTCCNAANGDALDSNGPQSHACTPEPPVDPVSHPVRDTEHQPPLATCETDSVQSSSPVNPSTLGVSLEEQNPACADFSTYTSTSPTAAQSDVQVPALPTTDNDVSVTAKFSAAIPKDCLLAVRGEVLSGSADDCSNQQFLEDLLSKPVQWMRCLSVADALRVAKARNDSDPNHLVVLDFDNTLFSLKGDAWTLGLSTDFNADRLERITSLAVTEALQAMNPSQYIVVTRKNQEGADEALEVLQDLYPAEQRSNVVVIKSLTDAGNEIPKADIIVKYAQDNGFTSISLVDDGQGHLELMAAALEKHKLPGWLFLVDLIQDMKQENGITPEEAQANVTAFFATLS